MSEQGQQSRRIFSGRYELHRQIGRGGMADVFLARDQLLDRPVALKVLFPEFSTDPSFVERFRREAQSAANLTHPNIVGVYDWGEEAGTYFIVMEYVQGRSLAEIIRNEGALRPDISADIAIDIAAALGFAHQSGVVHRDIKPGNVLVSPTGQVKVTDFGIARAFNGGVDNDLTQAGNVMGTATYFSPEQAQGLPLDPRSDLYSLGVVLYEMTTGKPPFTGDNPLAIAYKHVQDTPAPPSSRNPAVPRTLEAITLKALSKDLAVRYPSAADFSADLQRFRRGDVLGQRPPAEHPVTAQHAIVGYGGEPTIAVPAAVARQVPAGVAVGAGYPVATAPNYAEPPPPERRRTWLFVLIAALFLAVLAVLVVLFVKQISGTKTPAEQTISVPNLVGQPVETARVTLEAAGLKVQVLSAVVDANTPAGVVLTQDPKAGDKAKSGALVLLTPSAGAEAIQVPNLVGKTDVEAKAALEALGLKADLAPEASPDQAKGVVLSQQPAANDKTGKGTTVFLKVSSGKPDVLVPDVKGKPKDDALVILAKAGLVPTVVNQPDATIATGQVIGTNPAAGQKLTDGSGIQLLVSSGPQQILVENVIGFDAATGTSKLTSKGLKVVTVSSSPALPAGDSRIGQVMAQNPAGGTNVNPGTTVTLTIGVQAATTTTATTTTTAVVCVLPLVRDPVTNTCK